MSNEDLADDLAAIDASFGALRDDEIDHDRADGERGAHLWADQPVMIFIDTVVLIANLRAH